MKILFVSNAPSLTGAPLVLLNFLKWIKSSGNELVSSILFLKSGDRQPEFSCVSDKIYFLPEEKKLVSILSLVWERLQIKLGIFRSEKDLLLATIAKETYDIIYCNTVVTLRTGIEIKKLIQSNFPSKNVKLICHIHELDLTIKQSEPTFDILKSEVDTWIAVSSLVKTNLITTYAIPPNIIHLVHAFIDTLELEKVSGIKNQVFTIGASGYAYWRKGSDVFIQVAARFFQCYPEAIIIFKWIGFVHPQDRLVIAHDLKKMGLQDKVLFTGETKNALEEFSGLDLFLMTSREDPFPLVCLEVGMLGKPIICFENATGSQEYISKGGGKIVPYGDIEAMKLAVFEYYSNPDLIQQDGTKIKELTSVYSIENQAPKLLDVLKNL